MHSKKQQIFKQILLKFKSLYDLSSCNICPSNFLKDPPLLGSFSKVLHEPAVRTGLARGVRTGDAGVLQCAAYGRFAAQREEAQTQTEKAAL